MVEIWYRIPASSKEIQALNDRLDRKESGFMKNLATKRYAKKVSRAIIIERLITISLILILLTIGVVYSVSYTYINSGYGINVISDQKISKAVSLSDDEDFRRLSVGLKASAIISLDNFSYDWFPTDLDELGGGSHNGENYICYTFYVLNTGDEDLEYNSNLRIKHSTLDVEEAIRVKVYKDGIPTIYTHTYEEQIDAEIEASGIIVEEFYSDDVIAHNVESLDRGDFIRYTVVIWLEGRDYDCVNDKFSSELQMTWNISVIE